MKKMAIKTYSELTRLHTFEERFEYLKLKGEIGKTTFGFDRWINQDFYRRSKDWKLVRNIVIARDLGLDLGCEDYPIRGLVVVHHINPITEEDIVNGTDLLLNPEFLICASDITHKAIHYGDTNLLPKPFVERRPNDTCPWRK